MLHSQLILASALLVLLTLPGTVELALLTFAGLLPLPDRRRAAVKVAKLAIVIPAHNEAAAIARCVRSIAACFPPDSLETEIVVIADNCTDATADFARAAGARVLERSDSSRRGKGFALNSAFEVLLGEAFDARPRGRRRQRGRFKFPGRVGSASSERVPMEYRLATSS